MNYFKIFINLYRLRRQAKLSAAQLKKLQDKKLRRLLHAAWERSAYYRRAFEKAGISKGQLDALPLSSFPTLDKKALLEHFDELVTEDGLTQEGIRAFDAQAGADQKTYQGKYHVVHSSGSAGKPGYFVYDEKAWGHMLLGIIRAALWGMSMPQILGLLMRRPRIVYIAATDGRYGGAMAVGDGIDGVGASQMYLDINTPLEEWVKRLNEFRPNIVIGYPSAVKIMAELAEQGQIKVSACAPGGWKIDRVISCGEPLGANLRDYLERIFGTQPVNFYGASESLALGVETDPREGMALFDDMNVIEIEDGKMYLTCLYNFTQPLIRYQLTDSLTLERPGEGEPCSFTRAAGLLGRDEDILWFEDGRGRREFLHPLAIEGFCVEGLKDYQFRQTAKDAFEMYVETAKGAREDFIRRELLRMMGEILAEKNLGYVRFRVRFVEEILPDKGTGKKPLIISAFFTASGP